MSESTGNHDMLYIIVIYIYIYQVHIMITGAHQNIYNLFDICWIVTRI
jgi:hypothetical protein